MLGNTRQDVDTAGLHNQMASPHSTASRALGTWQRGNAAWITDGAFLTQQPRAGSCPEPSQESMQGGLGH